LKNSKEEEFSKLFSEYLSSNSKITIPKEINFNGAFVMVEINLVNLHFLNFSFKGLTSDFKSLFFKKKP